MQTIEGNWVFLFNFGNEDFEVYMGDKIAQLIFEVIETPQVVETDILGDNGRRYKGYGNTGINLDKSQSINQFKRSRLRLSQN